MKRDNGRILQHKIHQGVDSFSVFLKEWKEKHNEKIVFTNGCFDILHLGHIDYLSRAADLGTKLIVGLNTDSSTKKLKGSTRPINDEKSRSGVLAALFFVDAVILFDQDTPLHLIREIQPNVLVKGADYSIEQIVGAKEVLQSGGEVRTLAFLEGYSTTSIEKRILLGHR